MKFTLFLILIAGNVLFAQKKLDSLLKRVDSADMSVSQINLIYTISQEYSQTNFNKSIYYIKKGIKKAIMLNDSLLMADGYLKLGIYYSKSGLYDKAMKSLLKLKISLK
jgi:tetratricopeptide (TPR) repeat protein